MADSVIGWLDIGKIVASSSLLTVFLTWGLNHLFVYRATLNRDARYLGLRLAVILEKFALDCAGYISDNNNYSGSDGHGGIERTSLPELGAFPTDPGWTALRPDLANDIMSLPNLLLAAANAIHSWWEIGEEDRIPAETNRKAGFYGFKSWNIAKALRHHYKILPSELVDVSWDFVTMLQENSKADEAGRHTSNAGAATGVGQLS